MIKLTNVEDFIIETTKDLIGDYELKSTLLKEKGCYGIIVINSETDRMTPYAIYIHELSNGVKNKLITMTKAAVELLNQDNTNKPNNKLNNKSLVKQI